MDKVIESVVKALAENWGATVSISGIIATFGGYLFRALVKRRQDKKAAEDLKPEFDYLYIKELSDIFIQTKATRISPNRCSNPDEAYKHGWNPFPLIKFMLKTSFNEKVENEKFYLVLADSGMGKTAFMVNLYLRNYSFFNFNEKYTIKLLRFQSPDRDHPVDVLERLKKVEPKDVRNTILLLDGLDEDPFIFSKDKSVSDETAFNNRIHQIVSATWEYKNIVITCRTQYFPQQEADNYELTIKKPNDKGFYKLQKYYIFPFSNADIDKFLDKKYGIFKFWNRSKKKIAQQIVKDNSNLLARPMLMSYIDYLVEDDIIYTSSLQVYEVLIEKWLIRESQKWKKEDQQDIFIENLRHLSHRVAIEVYNNWINDGKLLIAKERAKQIADQFQIELSADEVSGKSLLTCDANLNWKFAHKSILEFFLAQEIFENIDFAIQFDFSGMDMARSFISKIIGTTTIRSLNYVQVNGGDFLMGSPENEVDRGSNETQHKVELSDFWLCKYVVTVSDFKKFVDEKNYLTDAEKGDGSYIWNGKEWKRAKGINWRFGVSGILREIAEYDHPVLHVSWNDAVAYCEWLSAKTFKTFRLPTEAEWEFACRAGTTTPFNTGENLTTEQANYHGHYPYNNNKKGTFRENTVPVNHFKPNSLELYNMHGNVWEWCSDWYGEKYYDECMALGTVENPEGPKNGSNRVVRGGCWRYNAQNCRAAYRSNRSPGFGYGSIGFRLVFVP
ncbi:MAG: SUMF1/EgtB/PvdO family nonheme iron enzyme [Mariniphaga sp.]